MTVNREMWQRARALFDELVELEPGRRRAMMKTIARTDPQLRHEVERLLSADADSESALRAYQFGSRDAAPDTIPRDPLGIVGRTVSHYRVNGFLAAGGMGVVYSADDLTLGRSVALKFPLPHRQLEPAVQERFFNEARSAATLDHPALCTIHEIGESDYGVFMAMPLYSGETLKERLGREGRLDVPTALPIVRQVTAGLAAAHAAGIIHRDLKPANVMLLPDGSVKVLDFGLAKINDVDLTQSKLVLGTIGYVAPEQLRGERPDKRVDLWAIGVMLYEMLAGTPPFRGEHEVSVLHAILHEQPPHPSELNSDIAAGFDDLIGGLLQKDPADRYQSADALLSDLDALQRGSPITMQTPFWSRSARRRRVRRRLPAAAVAVLAVALVTWGVVANARERQSDADAGVVSGPVLEWIGDTTVVDNVSELIVALDPSNSGRRIRMRPGTYDIEKPLVVPDGVMLEGAGIMRFDLNGQPQGFTDDTRTTITMVANVGGDMLTLGNDATVRNIEVVDLPGRSGNIIAVVSRRTGDSVSATITESVVVNPNPLTIGAGGALGRGLYVVTLNPNMGSAPPAHDGSVLAVRMVRSIIQSPAGGGGFFVYNFSANSRIAVDISESVIGGSSEANGGVSRPDAVHDSEVRIESHHNLYRNDWEDPCVSPLLGWNLTGGSGAPIPFALPATTRNHLVVRSVDDRLEGFTTTIVATGSRRFFAEPLNVAPTDNAIDLLLSGTTISAPTCGNPGRLAQTMGIAQVRPRAAGDFVLTGAWAENDALYAGDRNTVRAEFRNVTGSGKRENQYEHVAGLTGPTPAALQGTGNRLVIVGDPRSFDRSNRRIDPRPLPRFFSGEPATPRPAIRP